MDELIYYNGEKRTYEEFVSAMIAVFPTKHKEGFTKEEADELKIMVQHQLPVYNREFEEALFGNAVLIVNEEEVFYPNDVYQALMAGIRAKRDHEHRWVHKIEEHELFPSIEYDECSICGTKRRIL
jgi:hypothetical protein